MTNEQKIKHIVRLLDEADVLEAKAQRKRAEAERLKNSMNDFRWAQNNDLYTCEALKDGEVYKAKLFAPFSSLSISHRGIEKPLPAAYTTRQASVILFQMGFVPKKH
jgi:hypothetical protein